MAIYDFLNAEKNPANNPADFATMEPKEQPAEQKSTFFSVMAARLFFFLLLLADILWACYSLLVCIGSFCAFLLSGAKVESIKRIHRNAFISFRRSLVCGLSLFVALFSPAFGIMVACTYFLMYDKSGIEDVVPTSLQSQFKEFFPKE